MTRRILSHPALWIGLLAIGLRLLPGPRIIDDAYITFRYTQNLLAGHGLVYNPGEAVLGTTTPAFALLLAGVSPIPGLAGVTLPQIAVILNALLDGVNCALLVLLGRRLTWGLAGALAALAWAIAPWSVTFAIGGMETSLFVACMLATFYFHSGERPVRAALFGALSLLTRPDALLFLAPLAIERIRRSLPVGRWNPEPLPIRWRELAAALVPLALWGAFGWASYGNPLPQTIAAKAVAYQLPSEAAFVRLLQHFGTPFMEHLAFGPAWLWVGLVLYPALYLLGSIAVLRRNLGAWPMFAFPAVFFLAYAIANPLLFRWYLAPPLPVFLLGIFIGLERIGRDLRHPRLVYAFALPALLLMLNGWTLTPDHGPRRPAPDMAYIALEGIYQQVAERLKPQIAEGEVLAAGDIGVLGYFTSAHMLDTVGLITPAASGYYPLPPEAYVINYAISTDLILDLHPTWLVMLEVYGRNTLLQDPGFLAAYEQVDEIPTDIYGSQGMLIFRAAAAP
jgi:hypothetical protein